LAVFFLSCPLWGQGVVINEFMSSNGTTIADEDWEYSDWVELYNSGTEAVNLAGWGLSDDSDQPFRWTFPTVMIEPGQYLLVWASGKDRKPQEGERSHGLLRELYMDITGGGYLDLLLNYPDFPDGPTSRSLVTESFEAPSNIADHYGQRMHGYIQAPVTGNYRFWLAADNGSRLYLSTDETPGNAVAIAEIPGDRWSDPRQWTRFSEQTSALIPLQAGQYYYICALMKEDVGGDHLCVRWQLPDGTIEEPIPGSRLFYAELQLHTNFAISADGEELFLTMPDGTPASQTPAVELIGDVSYGRAVDGGDSWAFFAEATPQATNSGSTGFLGIEPAVEFSQAPGFYTEPFDVTLSSPDPEAQIYYTLDGSIPESNNLTGTSYEYKNSYPSGAMLYRRYQSFAYEQPLHVAQNQLPLTGISSINTENNAGGAASNWTIDGNEVVQSSTGTQIRLMFGDTAWTDYELTCQAKKTSGSEGFMFFFRVNGNRFYSINFGGWANALHGIEKGYDNGSWSVFINRVSGSIATDQWYNVRIRCEGNRFQCWLNDWMVFDFSDTTELRYLSGQVGLGTWSTQARFRNIEIKGLNGTPLFSGLPGRSSDVTVLRARSYRPGYIPSVPVTQSYFVNPDLSKRHTIPVVSLAVEEPDFFSYQTGIYVAGINYNNTGNYWMRGDSWERPVSVSLFEPDGTLGFSQDLGSRIHGGWTRNLPQKALRLYARGDYGQTEIDYPVFPGLETTLFKRLLLRNSGNDWGQTLYRDGMMQRLVEHLPLDTQAYRPAVLYINGEYWGINNLRQRFDKYYLSYKYGVNPDRLDILEYQPNTRHLAKEGDTLHFDQTLSYIEANGLSNPVHYAEIQTRIDTDNFIDYNVSQIYFNNTDWPGNNNDWWRLRTDSYEPAAAYGHDGRWRWMLYDTDFGFGLSGGADSDTLSFATSTTGTGWPNPHWTTYLLRKLLENDTFRTDFINRYADLLNTAFLPERVIGVIDEMKTAIAPEINRHIDRWKSPGSYSGWEGSVQVMRSFAQQRPAYARTHLRSKFGLGADQTLTLNVSNAAHGYVRVNKTDINASTPGVNAAAVYPWSGTYFQGVPITLTAVAETGYRFSYWQTAGGQTYTEPSLTLSLTAATSITAYFEEAPKPSLLHYWSFNNALSLQSPTYTIAGGQMTVQPGGLTEVVSDTGQNFGLNNQMNEPAGTHLRLNYPIGAELVFSVPTTGYEAVVLRYETRRSGAGAGQQRIFYSIDGTTFTLFETITVADADPVLQTIDFSGVTGAAKNPQFKVKIEFAQGGGGTAGNNRFDNLTIEGLPLAGTNPPPRILGGIDMQEMIEGASVQMDVSAYFSDNDALTYTAAADKPFVAEASIAGHVLTVFCPSRGDARVTVSAGDGVNPPVMIRFQVLVYPQARPLRLGLVRFGAWSADEPEYAFPADFLFLQSDVSDPGLDQTLLYAYTIPHEDYAAADQAVIGLPYTTTSRTRINGLGEDGISFINTGRGRDVGGALTAVDTTGLEAVRVRWLGGTILRNSRLYAIRLQYRLGHTGPFADVLKDGLPVEYQAQADGHTQWFTPVELPAEAVNQPYVQLLWRYYNVSGSGSRPQLRLDDIAISGVLDVLEDAALFAQWWLRTDCAAPERCGGADLTLDGRVDLNDFSILAGQWMNENTIF
jgi:hypothetical protein